MQRRNIRRTLALATATLVAGLPAATVLAPVAAAHKGSSHTRFYVPPPNDGAVTQIAELKAAGKWADAYRIKKMIQTPSSVWFTDGTPKEVRREVRSTTWAAARQRSVPVLVAYNLPFRDCSQYSAGGAASMADYKAWIDGFAAGIGKSEAIVILEPDGLGIIPWYTTVNGDAEWCQPAEADPEVAQAERFEMLNHAVDAFAALPRTKVYLDGTGSSWLGAGDSADRLIKAGVTRADGFFLNVSNYEPTQNLEKYATWVSQCVALVTNSWWQPQWCASQYYPATPTDFSTWGLSDAAYAQAFADTGVTFDPETAPHAVLDTSRNGQGAWTPPAGVYSDPQTWCNPPGRGLGARPTTKTSTAVVDALLWVKIPGESDGQCGRGLPGTDVVDPEWGFVDPAAGSWFPEQALELARLAVPRLR